MHEDSERFGVALVFLNAVEDRLQTETEDGTGYCRRYPSTIAHTEEQLEYLVSLLDTGEERQLALFTGRWPEMNERDWCGEFRSQGREIGHG